MIEWLRDTFSLNEAEAKLVVTGLAFVALALFRWVTLYLVHRRIDDPTVWYRARKLVTYVISTIFVLTLAWLWLAGGSVGIWIGFLTAGLAIALADVIKNLAGWSFIVLRRPFRVGDRIEVDGNIGDIVDIRAFRFSMLEVGNWVHADQSTGRIMHVPNGVVFTEAIANYTMGFEYIWHEVELLVTFESDWELAEQIMLEAVTEHAVHHDPARAAQMLRRTAREYQIRYTHLTPAAYLTVKDSGVLVTGRLLAEVRRRRAVEDAVWKSILRRLRQEPTVQLAYPTVRTFLPDPIRLAGPGSE